MKLQQVFPLKDALLVLIFLSLPVRAQVFPSAGVSFVSNTNPDTPTDSEAIKAGLTTPDSVRQWESKHADFIAGSGLENHATLFPAGMRKLDYTYLQMLNGDGFMYAVELEANLRKYANRTAGSDYESFYLHFKVDTWLNVTILHQNRTAWAGQPEWVGYKATSGNANTPLSSDNVPWLADVLQGASSGGAFYVAMPEIYDQMTLSFNRFGKNGAITIEYPAAVDANFNVTQWKPLTLQSDGTAGFSQDGTLKWTPPADWRWGWADTLNLVQKWAYWIRIRGTGFDSRPLLDQVRTKPWIEVDPNGLNAGFVRIRGWDPANDRNGNGYVEESEFANLVNPAATARFRYESRVARITPAWESTHALCFSNLRNPDYQKAVAQIYQKYWSANGYQGGFNDNLWTLLSPEWYPVKVGGTLWEYSGRTLDPDVQLEYGRDLDRALASVKAATKSRWIGANIFSLNPYDYSPYASPNPSLGKAIASSSTYDWFLIEGAARDSISMVGADSFTGTDSGLSRIWQIPAFAKRGIHSMLLLQVGNHLVTPQNNTLVAWERSIMGLLAQYYLFHIPNRTSFFINTTSGNYISGNTTAQSYYKAGVPVNVAYQPTQMLSVDIGVPVATPFAGYEPMPYTAAVSAQASQSNTIVGYSTDVELHHPINGTIPVIPTNTFYLYKRSPAPFTKIVSDAAGTPFSAEVVLARAYTKGLVVVRTPFSAPLDYAAYSADGNAITVPLPGKYQRVNYDGTLSPAISQLTLNGFEGAVLVGPVRPPLSP